MKNDNTLIIGLLVALFLLELSNQLYFIKLKRELNRMNETIVQYFEPPLPDINFKEESQDGRNQ
jgi:hypothetical protein